MFAGEVIVALTFLIALPDSGDSYGRSGGGAVVLFGFAIAAAVLIPVLLGLGFLHAVVFTRPALALARRTGRGAAAVAWLLSASAVSALVAWCAGAPYGGALAWIAGIGVPPLLVAHLALRAGTRPGAVVARTSVATPVLVLVALATVSGMSDAGAFDTYEPPTLESAEYVGEWRGEGSEVIRLYEGGGAHVERVKANGFGSNGASCTGTGTWTARAEEPRYGTRAGVDIEVRGCSRWGKTWEVAGTAARPRLFQWSGDPDAGDLRILRRTGTAETAHPHG
ncbi:hypothetical protein [Streptomyces sp. IMTB 1903]|uniref:hypothetical protein n=1 Tax=Streptomyces sp. IMTB 1903 TaxID=1776680 RepID=UPI000753DF99|nr:hypothetical protein [Streptomyces sp. IMTB 1903]